MIDSNQPSIAQLLKHIQQIPYVASKNVYRVVAHFLSMDDEKAAQFCSAVLQAKQNCTRCSICFTWMERTRTCSYCMSSKRNQRLICVVETWQDLIAIEKTGGYQGVFHVLGGSISPLDGMSAQDLTIDALVVRVLQGVDEVILATNQTPEGEATAAYIAHKLKPYSVSVSCLSRGVPVGASLESMDRLTVYKALSERRPF